MAAGQGYWLSGSLSRHIFVPAYGARCCCHVMPIINTVARVKACMSPFDKLINEVYHICRVMSQFRLPHLPSISHKIAANHGRSAYTQNAYVYINYKEPTWNSSTMVTKEIFESSLCHIVNFKLKVVEFVVEKMDGHYHCTP